MKVEVRHNENELVITASNGTVISMRGEIVLIPLKKTVIRRGIKWVKTGDDNWFTEANNGIRCSAYKWNKKWQLVAHFKREELTCVFSTALDMWKAAYNGLSQVRPGADWKLKFKVEK